MLDRRAPAVDRRRPIFGIGGKQFERAIEPRAGLKQKRKVERKNRDVFRSNALLELEIEVRSAALNFLR